MESLESFSYLLIHCLPKLLVAFVCGTAIGAEREMKGKPAGLRTNILICGGSTLFTLMSIMLPATRGVATQDESPLNSSHG